MTQTQDVPRLAYGLAALAAACLPFGVFLSEGARNKAAMPGALTAAHADLAADCTACHAANGALNHPLDGWKATRLELEESSRCLACHRLGSEAMLAHGRPSATSVARTPRENELPLSLAAAIDLGPPLSESGEIGCQTCHHEHRGRGAQLAEVSDAGCQVCHVQTFASFADGHPEFASLPSSTRVVFDHGSHFERHFEGEPAAPRACSACHIPAAEGRIGVESFERACAACHVDDIRGAGQTESAGLAVLAVPALDVEALSTGGFDIAPWPADSMECETVLTPFMELLLTADEEGAQALLGVAAIDLLDLLDAGPDELAAAARFANAVRALFADIAEGGHAVLLERVERALGHELSGDHHHGFIAGLPESLLQETQRVWFGENSQLDLPGDRSRERWPAAGGWYRRDADLTLRYRPGEHLDPFLRTWLELSTEHYADSESPLRHVYAELSRPEATGTCMNCHRVEAAGSALHLAWQPRAVREGLTRFSHEPHLVSRAENACAQCHVLDPQEDGQAISGFLAPQRATCLECHVDQKASDSCLTCHNYHAAVPQPIETPLDALRSPGGPQ